MNHEQKIPCEGADVNTYRNLLIDSFCFKKIEESKKKAAAAPKQVKMQHTETNTHIHTLWNETRADSLNSGLFLEVYGW